MSQVNTNAVASALPERRIDINPHPPGPPDMAQAQQGPGHQGPGQRDQAQQDPGQQEPAQQDPGQQDEIPPGELDSSDSSGAIFSMYLERAKEEDKEMVESWKGDAEGMLLFTGLFSAAVAALLAISVPDIRPSSQDISAFYLAHIYQQLSQSNVTIPPTLSDPTQPFSPPLSSVWVNGLWFSSLCISLTCALLATLVQQWARRYLRVAYPRLSPHKRARIRAFYSEGVVRLRVPYTVEALPALLHLSLFLFFAGLAVFLFSVHLTLFKVVMSWIGLCVVVYAYITFLPIVYKDSPYFAPLSIFASFCLTGLRYGFVRFLDRFPGIDSLIFRRYRNHGTRTGHLENFFSHSMSKTAEKFALGMGPNIDYRAFSWTLESLDEDNELEKFFEGVPGLCKSGLVPNIRQEFIQRNEKKLSGILIGLMNRTLASNLVSDVVKRRRIIICTKVVDATSLLGPWWILRRALLGEWYKFLECIEFARYVQNLDITHKVTAFYAKCAAAVAISNIREHDEPWYQLASGQLRVSKSFVQYYVTHGDSILLANAIFIIRQIIQTFSGSAERHRSDILGASSKTLESVCRFDIRQTAPKLQHEFCGLWNKLVEASRTNEHAHVKQAATATLKNIRKLYFALHEGSGTDQNPFVIATEEHDSVLDDAYAYHPCQDPSHRPLIPVPDLELEDPPIEPANAPPTPISAAAGLPPAVPPGSRSANHYYPPPISPPPFPVPFSDYSPAHHAPNCPQTVSMPVPDVPLPRHDDGNILAATIPVP